MNSSCHHYVSRATHRRFDRDTFKLARCNDHEATGRWLAIRDIEIAVSNRYTTIEVRSTESPFRDLVTVLLWNSSSYDFCLLAAGMEFTKALKKGAPGWCRTTKDMHFRILTTIPEDSRSTGGPECQWC